MKQIERPVEEKIKDGFDEDENWWGDKDNSSGISGIADYGLVQI